MLFVLVMEVLNHRLGWIERRGMLTPIHGYDGSRISLYADDLMILVRPLERDLEAVKATLNIFGLASGLFSNLDKSMATPLNCIAEDVERVHNSLACRVQSFPCRYLGVPLSIYKLKRSKEQYLLDRIAARIPGWKGQLLNAAGRTALVKATLSAVPIHTSIALCLSPWGIDSIDKLRRSFIWAGTDFMGGGKCKVAWTLVCKPTSLGGLGISDLRRMGVALRVRWVWKDRHDGRAPRTTERAVLALFQAATVFTLGNGESTFFWTDRWINGESLQHLAPTVFAAVKPRKRKATVADALNDFAWVRHIAGPRTMQLVVEFGRICDLLEHIQLTQQPDTFSWRLSEDQNYSAASAYGAMFLGSSTPIAAKEIWKTAAPPLVRFFFWLVMHGRCWTAARRFRHGLQSTDACVLCDQASDTMDHLLLGCCFSKEVWHIWLSKLHLVHVVGDLDGPALPWWLKVRKLIPKLLRRGFDSFFLVGWMLWKQRNARTFENVPSTAVQLASMISDEADDWCAAGNRHLASLLVAV
jgi:hypothetical protein